MLSHNDWEFIWSAVEAGWTTPRIIREFSAEKISVVWWLARQARAEMREKLRVCEHCRRDIAKGVIPASDQSAASATARPQVPVAQRRDSAEDAGPDGPAGGQK